MGWKTDVASDRGGELLAPLLPSDEHEATRRLGADEEAHDVPDEEEEGVDLSGVCVCEYVRVSASQATKKRALTGAT